MLSANLSFAGSVEDYSKLYVQTYTTDFYDDFLPESIFIDGGLCFDGSCDRITNTDYWFIKTEKLSTCHVQNLNNPSKYYDCIIENLEDKKKYLI